MGFKNVGHAHTISIGNPIPVRCNSQIKSIKLPTQKLLLIKSIVLHE